MLELLYKLCHPKGAIKPAARFDAQAALTQKAVALCLLDVMGKDGGNSIDSSCPR